MLVMAIVRLVLGQLEVMQAPGLGELEEEQQTAVSWVQVQPKWTISATVSFLQEANGRLLLKNLGTETA